MSDFGKGINVPSKDIVYRQDVEDMLRNALPSRGMWEIEGDVVKNTICETVVDLMMDLEKLPSAQPEIIRCKDCVHNDGGNPISDGRYWCMIHNSYMYYCSDGELRGDSDD